MEVDKMSDYDLIKTLRGSDLPYASTLCADFERTGRLSPRQQYHARRMAAEILAAQAKPKPVNKTDVMVERMLRRARSSRTD